MPQLREQNAANVAVAAGRTPALEPAVARGVLDHMADALLRRKPSEIPPQVRDFAVFSLVFSLLSLTLSLSLSHFLSLSLSSGHFSYF